MSNPNNYVEVAPPAVNDQIIFDNTFASGNPAFLTPVADAAFVGNLQSLALYGNYAGTLTVSRNLTVNQVTTSKTPISLNQAISIDTGITLTATAMTLYGGKIEGAGKLSISGAVNARGSLMVTGPTPNEFEVAEVTIDANSSMTISSNTTLNNGLDLENDGSINWVGGNIAIPGTLEITNRGTFLISGSGNRTYGAGGGWAAAFLNNGGFTVALATPTDSIQFVSRLDDTPLAGVNHPPLSITTGMLFFNMRVYADSQMNLAAGAGLTIATPFFKARPGSSISGQGNLQVTGAITVLANTNFVVAPKLNLVGGELTGAGSFLLSSGLYITSGGTIDTTTVSVAGSTTFYAPAGGNAAANINSSTLQFAGGTWYGGRISVDHATLVNVGSFNISSVDGMIDGGAVGSVFTNTTLGIVKFSGGILTPFSASFTTAGTVDINGGIVEFSRGFTQTAGTVKLNGGILDLKNLLNLSDTYTLSGGVLQGNGKIDNGNVIVQQGGTLELIGVFNLVGNLTVDVGGTLQVDLIGAIGSMTATGSATLNGTLTVYIPSGGVVPPKGTKKTIISAAGGANRPPADPAGWKTTALNADDIELEKL